MEDIVELDHWLTADEISNIKRIASAWPVKNYWARQGRFEGELVTGQSYYQWTAGGELENILGQRMFDALGPHQIVETVYQTLYYPWDIHTDWYNQASSEPYRALVIPLDDYPGSRTVFFNQRGDYRDFYKYKQQHSPIDDCVDLEFWNSNLSHCWDDDRRYLSLKHVSQPWQAGRVMHFPRNLFHSSDDFHVRQSGPKCFLQILTDHI